MVHIRELTLASLLLALPASASLYSKSGPVLQLDNKNFDNEILQSNHASIVEFFAPWCGHCKNLAPAYEKAAKSLKGLAKVAAVNCDEEKNKPLCGQHGIQGFPTLKIFKPTDKRAKPIVEDYQGARTAKAIVDAVVDKIPNHVTRVTDKTLEEFLSQANETAKSLLFTSKGTTSAMYKSLAIDFLGSMKFAQIRDKEKEAAEVFGITEFPKIVILPGGEAPGKVYEGEMKRDPLFQFLSTITPPPKAPKASESPKSKKAKESDSGEPASEVPPVVKEVPKVQYIIPEFADESSLVDSCFARKSKTCILALVEPPTSDPALDPKLTGINEAAAARKSLRIYKVPSATAHGKSLAETLELGTEHPTIIAVNGAKRWYKKFSGTPDKVSILAWLDAIKMGEGKKEKIPAGFMEQQEEPEQEQESAAEATGSSSSESVDDATSTPEPIPEEKSHDEL